MAIIGKVNRAMHNQKITWFCDLNYSFSFRKKVGLTLKFFNVLFGSWKGIYFM